MTTLIFKMRTPEGAPIAATWFRIEPGYQDSVVQGQLPVPVEFVTNGNGEATVTLVATTNPYFLSKSHAGDDYPVAFKFFVPASTLVLSAEVLYVDLGTHLHLKNDASLSALIDAKVACLNAMNQVKLIASVVLPGSQGIATLNNAVDTLQVQVASFEARMATLASTTAAATTLATQRADQAVLALSNASANTVQAVNLAGQAKVNAQDAFTIANQAKATGITNTARIAQLEARLAAASL